MIIDKERTIKRVRIYGNYPYCIDKIYTRMLKNKDKAIQKMNMEIEKLQNAERSRAQTVEYFKKRVQVLEKETNNKEWERWKEYAKKIVQRAFCNRLWCWS